MFVAIGKNLLAAQRRGNRIRVTRTVVEMAVRSEKKWDHRVGRIVCGKNAETALCKNAETELLPI